MRWTFKIAAVLCSLAAVGCATSNVKRPPTVPVVTAAPRQPSSAEPIAAARSYSHEASESAEKARSGVSSSRADLEVYRVRVSELAAMVDKLRLKGNAAASDLKALYDALTRQDSYISGMVAKLKAVEVDLESERKLRHEADLKIVEVGKLAAAKEIEADQLRQQLADEKNTARLLSANADDNFAAAQKGVASVDKLRGERKMLWIFLIGAATVALVSIVLNVILIRSKIPI